MSFILFPLLLDDDDDDEDDDELELGRLFLVTLFFPPLMVSHIQTFPSATGSNKQKIPRLKIAEFILYVGSKTYRQNFKDL